MRHILCLTLCLTGATALSGCGNSEKEQQAAIAEVTAADEANLSDIMLTVGNPADAVAYFQKLAIEQPTRMDIKRDLGVSLIRADRPTEAVTVWRAVVASPEGTNEDKVQLASALIRTNDWKGAAETLNTVPPTYETYERYRLEAMVADSQKNWKKADSFYEIAVGLTTQPANVLNNWGFSKLTRGDNAGAERLFAEALTYDPKMFTAKNNLVLARAAQGKYDLPVISMTQEERAQLLYTAGLAAVKQGQVSMGKDLLQQAIDTSPQYFEAAVRSLAALEG
ncbi:MAG: tetratricopeptide repeat protein [Rhodobacteraceae bacterium]|nr:tetratricopeptide repeat protein [Paracoccaceae bacterium]